MNGISVLCFGVPLYRVVHKSLCFHTKPQNIAARFTGKAKRVVGYSFYFVLKCSHQEEYKVEDNHFSHTRWNKPVKYVSITLLCLFVSVQLIYTYVALQTIRKYISLGLVAWPGIRPGWLAPPLLLLHCLKFGTLVGGTLVLSCLRVLSLYLFALLRYSVPSFIFVYICWELVKPDKGNKVSIVSSKKLSLPTSLSTREWYSVEQIAEILSKNGLQSYSSLFLEHAIDGQVLSQLTEQDLKEMGINCIGDRKRIMLLLDIDE
ncbi:hypothetical protein GpartN1_g7575.t1 [Galdieria partita]|uniref:SAM domain-containing protein n=1 Tax=Galdieria partita TaxID=83374 RepID=A0A9C7Q509_9RHOD|nr:hypothetical protein GpartN1_g7575.t1 [Galdieria partita]